MKVCATRVEDVERYLLARERVAKGLFEYRRHCSRKHLVDRSPLVVEAGEPDESETFSAGAEVTKIPVKDHDRALRKTTHDRMRSGRFENFQN